MKGVEKDMAQYLNDFQFGVEISSGADAVWHSANMVLSRRYKDGSLVMLTVDISNGYGADMIYPME
jgi:hypothetical protein